jgi:NarL family two-component system response regulator LiaR
MTTNGKTIRVMTVDDHEIMRDGIRFVLLAFDDMEFVGEARRGEDAVKLCQECKPDVVLVDMKMTGMDGVQTTEAIKQACADVQVLILTSFHDPNLVRRAMRAGAVGYLLKDTNKEDLAAAIRAAKSGQTTFSPEAVDDLVADTGELAIELTERERMVLTFLAQGMSNKEIGKLLNRSPFTVRHHVSQLIIKLSASNRAEVAAIAVERGLI